MAKGFIAYSGKELTEKDIKSLLEDVVLDEYGNFEIITKKADSVILGQVNYSTDYMVNYNDLSLPYSYDDNLFYVANYDLNELIYCADGFEDEYELNCFHELILSLYIDYDEVAFKILNNKGLNCSYASYDTKTKQLIVAKMFAGELFYGYTKQNHEIIFSDDEEVIKKVCEKANTFPKESYYVDGKFYNYTKRKETHDLEESQDSDLQSAKIDELNKILFGITDTTLRANIEKALNNFFEEQESLNKINEFIDKNLSITLQKKLLEIIKNEIENFNIQKQIQMQLNDISSQMDKEINEKITDALKKSLDKVSIPKINIIKLGDTEIGKTSAQFYHEKFEEVLSLVKLDEPVMLIGPAGSGKNHSISQITNALSLHMYYTNNASNEFKLTGFIDAGGNYRDTEFYKAFKNGGIFFLDEIDNSDPSALIVINSALANGYMAFPHEMVERHPNFRMIAAANTWGKGSDLQYVGRNALDGATLDRFDNIFFDYDRKLEKALYPSKQVLDFMWSFRDAVESAKMFHIVSTRGIGKVYKKEINGIPIETILRVNVIRNLNQDDLNIILGNMQNIDSNNKYYETIKTLKLVKQVHSENDISR